MLLNVKKIMLLSVYLHRRLGSSIHEGESICQTNDFILSVIKGNISIKYNY